jgi:hypothetical protein
METYNPPKISENSVFLYQATSSNAAGLRGLRSLELPTILAFGLLGTDLGFGILLTSMLYFLVLRGTILEPSRRLALRMDLLPDSETLYIQKMGFSGFLYGQSVRLDDMKLLNVEECDGKGRPTLSKDVTNFNRKSALAQQAQV